jgi:hypothetical protein
MNVIERDPFRASRNTGIPGEPQRLMANLGMSQAAGYEIRIACITAASADSVPNRKLFHLRGCGELAQFRAIRERVVDKSDKSF